VPDPKPKRLVPADIKSLARGYSDLSLRTLGGIAKDGKQEASRVAASIALLDRGWGRPTQDTTHEVKGEIKVILRKMLEDDNDG
jgi:hypothetical protein